MTLPAALRAIADRIEAAEAERRAAIAQLAEFAGGAYQIIDELGVALDADAAEVMRDGSSIEPDSASVLEADGERVPGEDRPSTASPSAPIHAGGVREARTPAAHAGGAGSTPASRSTPAFDPLGLVHCPDCAWQGKPMGLGTHRRFRHGHKAGDVSSSQGPINCPDCGESIAQKKNLSRHRTAAHGYEPWKPAPSGTGNGVTTVLHKGAEWFVCGRCLLKFPSRERLAKHAASHPPAPRGQPVGHRGVAASAMAAAAGQVADA